MKRIEGRGIKKRKKRRKKSDREMILTAKYLLCLLS